MYTYLTPTLWNGEVVSSRPSTQVKTLQRSSIKENNESEEVKTKC